MTAATPVSSGLRGCERALDEAYDVALLDLDGVVYVAAQPAPGAVEAIEQVRGRGMRCAFVTNNASRTPSVIAAHLRELGVAATEDDIVTAAQAAARLLADRLPPRARVLLVGGEGLHVAVRDAGLTPVATADDAPVAVVQGYSAQIGYAELAEAALAVRAGAWWVATNADTTMPSPRGLMPGNGALVAAVATATGAQPVFAGKPEAPLHEEALQRTGARTPLVVGDRLDTDIEAAVRAGSDSLLVLTGVTDPSTLLSAPPQARPSYVAADLSGLLRPHPSPRPVPGGVECRAWRACDDGDGRLRLERIEGGGGDDGLDALRALCQLAWSSDRPVAHVSGPPGVLRGLGLE